MLSNGIKNFNKTIPLPGFLFLFLLAVCGRMSAAACGVTTSFVSKTIRCNNQQADMAKY
jgi:hypothetical protein